MITRVLQSLAVLTTVCVGAAFASGGGPGAGDAKAQLKRDVGVWRVAIKMFANPAAEPLLGTGTETNTMLGDLWLVGQFNGELMGSEFEGLRRTGFDPDKQVPVVSWVDSTSPYPSDAEGKWDEATQTMTWTGTGKLPSGQQVKTKIVAVYNEDGTRTSTMYAITGEAEVKLAEFVYTRLANQATDQQPQATRPSSEQ